MKSMNKKRNLMTAPAVITVEASFIVPVCITVIVLLLGFNCFIFQKVTCEAMACESALYGVSRPSDGTGTAEGLAKERLDRLISERVMNTGAAAGNVKASAFDLTVSYTGEVMPELFGTMFRVEGGASAADLSPARVKLSKWILNYAARDSG